MDFMTEHNLYGVVLHTMLASMHAFCQASQAQIHLYFILRTTNLLLSPSPSKYLHSNK